MTTTSYPQIDVRLFPGGRSWYVVIVQEEGASPEEFFGFGTEAGALEWAASERLRRTSDLTDYSDE
jgi:hypothetical protein